LSEDAKIIMGVVAGWLPSFVALNIIIRLQRKEN
jgi:hypothetical protein